MTIAERLTAADLDLVTAQIAEGSAARDSWSRPAAGGFMRPDDAREYWCHLYADGVVSRVARVTAYRDAVGRWTIGDIDVFTTTETRDTIARDDVAAADILAAVSADDRVLVQPGHFDYSRPFA
jgi:hypothetical protein